MDEQTLRDIQLQELEMAKVLLELCQKHGLEVFAIGGTLLGAVRHGAFIPWDDDLDLGLKRPDYERFLRIAEAELKEPYSIHTCYNDKEHLYPYARVEDCRTHLQRDYTKNKTVQALWVDIFPLDAAPETGIRRKEWETILTVLRGLRNLSCFDALVNINRSFFGLKGLIYQLGMNTGIQNLLSTNLLLKWIDLFLKHFSPEKESCIGNPMGGHWFREVFPKEWFSSVTMLPFEDISIPCPQQYEDILSTMYGNYMELPPENQRNWHGTTLVKE